MQAFTQFRLSPEHTQQIAGVAQPVHVPRSPPQPHEEGSASSPPRSLPPVPVPPQMMGGIPTSQAKRKHKFELIIEVPSKRIKVPNNPSSSSSTASSSAVVGTHGQANSHFPTRKALGTTFKVDLNPRIRDITVTRDFMWIHFGVNPFRSFVQTPKAQFEKHGYNNFVFVRGVRTTK